MINENMNDKYSGNGILWKMSFYNCNYCCLLVSNNKIIEPR